MNGHLLPGLLSTEQVDFLQGRATMGVGVCGPLDLPWEASSSVSPRFSSQIEEEHLFLLGLPPSREGPGFWVKESGGIPPMRPCPHFPARGGLTDWSAESEDRG